MRAALYLRVSTKKQSVELQLSDLSSVASRLGWEVVNVYQDVGFSGALSKQERPALESLMQAAMRKEFELIALWSIDRLARSTVDLFHTMLDLRERGIELYVHKQAIDTSTPSGKLMWQILGVFAEFEREIIRDRVRAGIANARANGVKLGRPTLDDALRDKVLELRSTGMGMVKIGRKLKVGTSQVQRICESLQALPPRGLP
jgi:DNA invertase Pin-like site-specific DNA recombinase